VDEIPEEEAAELKTVGDVVKYVKEKTGEGD
jgi:acyl carrier protein